MIPGEGSGVLGVLPILTVMVNPYFVPFTKNLPIQIPMVRLCLMVMGPMMRMLMVV